MKLEIILIEEHAGGRERVRGGAVLEPGDTMTVYDDQLARVADFKLGDDGKLRYRVVLLERHEELRREEPPPPKHPIPRDRA